MAHRLATAVNEFLLRVDVLAWDNATAKCYGPLRARMESQGKVLGSLDLLIASHALEKGSILVTNDQAFSQVENLVIEDWTCSIP